MEAEFEAEFVAEFLAGFVVAACEACTFAGAMHTVALVRNQSNALCRNRGIPCVTDIVASYANHKKHRGRLGDRHRSRPRRKEGADHPRRSAS